jgi:hypothetical protein
MKIHTASKPTIKATEDGSGTAVMAMLSKM